MKLTLTGLCSMVMMLTHATHLLDSVRIIACFVDAHYQQVTGIEVEGKPVFDRGQDRVQQRLRERSAPPM
jgi:hypothetical protein